MSTVPLLQLKNITKVFKLGGIFFGSKLTAVDNANLLLESDKPQILTLAGESGSGKTTLGRMILGMIPPSQGQILYKGSDISKLSKNERNAFKKEVQPIFQNPFESFNPLHEVDMYLMATTQNFEIAKSKEEARKVVNETLFSIGLDPEEILGRYPHEFSGGQLQRVAVARSLITKPHLLIADEPLSMVDASIRMSIINLFLKLKEQYNMEIIYITHDLAIAYYISDNIAIMFRGSILEYGTAEQVLTDPLHPYTQILLRSVPEPDPEKRWRKEIELSGLEVKEFEALGCKFVNRCPEAMEGCLKNRPPDTVIKGRTVKCWLYTSKDHNA